MLFRRKPPPEVSNDSYRRWLRAQRPPWLWFLGLSELEQEQLAILGDEHLGDVATAIGVALHGPGAPDEAATAAGNGEGALQAEESLLRQVAAAMVSKITAQRAAAPRPAPVAEQPSTMSGIAGRRVAAEKARHDARNGGRRLFGRAPDPATPGAP